MNHNSKTLYKLKIVWLFHFLVHNQATKKYHRKNESCTLRPYILPIRI